MTVTLRRATADDLEGMQRLASRVWPSGWHPGGLGWLLARTDIGAAAVVAVDGDGSIHGFVHDDEVWHTHVEHGRADVAAALVRWLLEDARTMSILVWDGAEELRGAVESAGLVASTRAAWAGLLRSVGDAAGDERRTPSGYAIRAVADDELDARVAVHRAAWKPSTLPYADGRVLDPARESSFTRTAYDAVRAACFYDRSFDLVAVDDATGALAACCIAWFDPSTGVAEIEPLGVAPDHRRRGLATGLCLEVAARVAARGGTHVYLNVERDPAYPASFDAYVQAGFEVVERATTYVVTSGA